MVREIGCRSRVGDIPVSGWIGFRDWTRSRTSRYVNDLSDLEVVGIDSGVEVLKILDIGPKVGCNEVEGISLDDRVLACARDANDLSYLEVVGIDSGVEVLKSLDIGPKVGCNGAEGISLDDRILACARDVNDLSDLEVVGIDSRIEVLKGLDIGSKIGRNGAQGVPGFNCVSGHDAVMSLLSCVQGAEIK